ncbi:MAG: Na+/H+ antiporter NhaA [Bacteroidetes bacterium]|nr:Na+/H+ antiporter NhaA [Bacteroidota bacterium]
MKKSFPKVFPSFIQIEGLSGILLFSVTILAMIWANSPYADSYHALWDYDLGLDFETFNLVKPTILWVNDGLMAIFFFLIGLEIKRELLIGELNSIRKATFPIFAALGGMFVPLTLFMLLNTNPETSRGWGIPMATDIAFSLAILNILGRYVPMSLKVFLTAFAIVDDLGAVLVIAFFYNHGISWLLLGIAIALLGLLFFLSYKGYYSKYLTLILGVVIWILFLKSGIHPTIAGVLLAFTVPIRRKIDIPTFIREIDIIEDKIVHAHNDSTELLSDEQIKQIDYLEYVIDKAQSPLQRLEHRLHGWVAYLIMPIFALANAGITFSADMEFELPLILNICIALLVGKVIGIPLFSYASIKLNLAELPENLNFQHIIGVAILAGVGFTMSIFIANLAFESNPAFSGSAKVGVLLGSSIAAIFGALILRLNGAGRKRNEAAGS